MVPGQYCMDQILDRLSQDTKNVKPGLLPMESILKAS